MPSPVKLFGFDTGVSLARIEPVLVSFVSSSVETEGVLLRGNLR